MRRAWVGAIFVLVLPAACRRTPAVPADGGARADAAVTPITLAVDGPFGAARAASGFVIAASGMSSPSIGLIGFENDGRERFRVPIASLPQPLAGAPTAIAFAAGGGAAIYVDRAGEPPRAVVVAADGKVVGGPTPIGADFCATDDSLVFIDRPSKRLRIWNRAQPAPRDDAAGLDEHASLLCANAAVFVLEPRGTTFHVFVPSRGLRLPLLQEVDTSAGGVSAFYTSGDLVGVVALAEEGHLVWSLLHASDAKPLVRTLSRKLAAEQTIVAVDGSADRVSVLLSRESRRKCGEEAAPPSYDVLEIIAKGGEIRDRVAPLPPQACDTDVSQPDLDVTATETRVRWFDTKDEDHSRRMHAWTLPASGTGKGIARPVALDSVWTDCERGCAAIAREGTNFKVVEAKSD
jgi:hypothetical protein